MKRASTKFIIVFCACLMVSINIIAQARFKSNVALAQKILNDSSLKKVDSMGRKLLSQHFNAGAGYSQVWIRDLNTFIDIAMEVRDTKDIRGALKVFFKLQQPNNEIVDGYVYSKEFREHGLGDPHPYFSSCDTNYIAFKNTVETDQETSLIQAVAKYVRKTNDYSFLNEDVCGYTIFERLEKAVSYLMTERYNKKYGLLWGAMTSDWGDVQPNTNNVVDIDATTTPAIDVYDNAMFIIALKDLAEIAPQKRIAAYYIDLKKRIFNNTRKYLWDSKNQKFIPHIYIDKSPIPPGFDESKVFYHGGTAVAIEAGLLNKAEIESSNAHMLQDVKITGAPSIGLTLYPVYPLHFFHGGMSNPYVYQNGGDWQWFGGRMVQQLALHGFISQAYNEIQPMIQKILQFNDFYEWYDLKGTARGSKNFKGSAGVICKAIEILRNWANNQM